MICDPNDVKRCTARPHDNVLSVKPKTLDSNKTLEIMEKLVLPDGCWRSSSILWLQLGTFVETGGKTGMR